MPAAQRTLTVLGDLLVELTSRLGGTRFRSLDGDALCYAPVEAVVGGTGANLALEAVRYFAAVNILGCVGDDPFGSVITQTLKDSSVRSLAEACSDTSTGMALYLRDSSTDLEGGVRLLVIDRGANLHIDCGYVEKHFSPIASSDIFFLDGYSFLTQPRRDASELAMRIARKGGAVVALDLVPHNAHLYFSREDIMNWFQAADLIITEVRTLRLVLGKSAENEVHDVRIAQETWELVRPLFPNVSFYLRFGVGNIEQSLICELGRQPRVRENGYVASSNHRGFGDRLSAAELSGYLLRRGTSRNRE